MQGQKTRCCVCGAELIAFGCPTPYDVCRNERGCARRVADQRDQLQKKLNALGVESQETDGK